MPSVLKIRDKDGNFVGIGALRGDRGKSAYEQAVEAGFEGTEEQFNLAVSSIPNFEQHLATSGNPHETTAEDVGALPIEGGRITGEGVVLGDGTGKIASGQNFIQLDVFDDKEDYNNRRKLVLNGVRNAQIPKCLLLGDVVNGEVVYYAIYGEHNKPSAADVGAIASKYTRSANLDTELTKGVQSMTVCYYDSNTQNTPKTEGLTSYAHGMVITNAYTDQYGVQLCMPSGDSNMYIRKKDGTGISGWAKVCNMKDIPAVPKASTVSTYTGTGTAGQDNPCTLTFEAPPKMVMIMAPNAAYVGFFIKGVNQYLVASANGFSTSGQECTWSGNTLSWHALSTGQYYQLNAGTQKYTYYVAY